LGTLCRSGRANARSATPPPPVVCAREARAVLAGPTRGSAKPPASAHPKKQLFKPKNGYRNSVIWLALSQQIGHF